MRGQAEEGSMTKARRSPRRRREMSPVHPDAAAIDIGATLHVAAVNPDRDPEPVRSFGTFTGGCCQVVEPWLTVSHSVRFGSSRRYSGDLAPGAESPTTSRA